ncbi:MAG: arsenate reductase [Pseudohongiellaceae bacterium]|jgi:arsenate reductase
MKILYICTHNRCRSILSEAITNKIAKGTLQAKSAGSAPAGVVHPLSLKYLQRTGYSTDGLTSQSWDDYENFNPDVVITVCDAAAGEACPLYFGNSLKVHWGLSDPSKFEGNEKGQEQAFLSCIEEIEKRAERLVEIANKNHDKPSLLAALANIGSQ